MSIQASIEIGFSTLHQDHTIMELIQTLLDGGWTLNDNGKVSYLPIGHDDVFDWTVHADISHDELMEILKEKEQRSEPVGVVLTWQDTNIGGAFIFQSPKKLSIDLIVNRKIAYGINNFQMTDGNWYLTRLLPIFCENHIEVYCFSFSEMA